MNIVKMKKNTLGDTRTAKRMPTKEEFHHSNWLHKDDVINLATEFATELKKRCGNHDWTKVEEPYASKFYSLMKATIEDGADFESGEWAHLHFYVLERHHLLSHCPEDVDLFDVLEMIFDCVSAGMTRSGSVYPIQIPSEVLQKAVSNTVDYLVKNVEVSDALEIEALEHEPKRGKWIAIDDTHSQCVECGAIFCITSNYVENCETSSDEWEVNYCPNCGAKLESEE